MATGLFALVMTGMMKFNESVFSVFEGLAGLSFVVLGLAGLFGNGSFLSNIFPLGNTGTLLSAGIIPLIYAVVGVKVASEVAGLAGHSFLYSKQGE